MFEKLWFSLTSTIYDVAHPYKLTLLSAVRFNPAILRDLTFPNLGDCFVMAMITIAIMWSIAYTLKNSPTATTLFLISLGLPFCLFLAKDFLIGGYATSIIRYHLPTVLLIYFGLGFSLGQLSQIAVPWQKVTAIAMATLIIQTEVGSSIAYIKAPSWWNRGEDITLPTVFAEIETMANPLVIMDNHPSLMVRLLILSRRLTIPFVLTSPETLPTLLPQLQNQGYGEFVFFKSSPEMEKQLKALPYPGLDAIEPRQSCYRLKL